MKSGLGKRPSSGKLQRRMRLGPAMAGDASAADLSTSRLPAILALEN